MAYRRRRRYTRRSYRKRVYARRNYRKRPMAVTIKRRRIKRRYSKPVTLRIKRTLVGLAMAGPTTVGVSAKYPFIFALKDVANLMRYDTMYDKFRLRGIKVKFYPPVSDLTDATKDPGYFYYQCDTDDSANAVFDDFINRDGIHKRRLVGKPFSYFFRPKYAAPAYEAGTAFPAIQADGMEWIDTQYTGIQHYSLKTQWISYAALGLNMTYDTTYYLEFKDLKDQLG